MVVVSKKHSVSKIIDLYQLGHRDFGENYASELSEKAEFLKVECPDIRWHFIGQIQSNKLKLILQHSSIFHSINNAKHLKKISDLAHQKVQYFINVNLNNEPQKNGLTIENAKQFFDSQHELTHVECLGLMSIPAASLTAEQQSFGYQRLVSEAKSIGAGKVSLGMSQDFEVALNKGSSYLRLGTVIMGARS